MAPARWSRKAPGASRLAAAALMLARAVVTARPFYQELLPNGARVPSGSSCVRPCAR